MANIASQKKRNARSLREHDENRRLTSAVKTYFKRLETAVADGDTAAVEAEHKALCSRIDTAVSKGALHRNTGARKKARAARIAAGDNAAAS
jgi:small subunit ribosomal protein S20